MARRTDRNGISWEVDEQGNPVPGTGIRPSNINPDPKRPVDLRKAKNEAAASDYDPALARDKLIDSQEQRRLDREKFEYQKEVDKLEREAKAAEAKPGGDKSGMYNSVIEQVNRLQELYAGGIGQTSGISGLQDYLPTSENKRFDSAGAALADQGLAAFKIPGMGSQSDADAERFARANEPAASDRDVVVLEKLRAIRQRLENNMAAAGLPAPKWDYDVEGREIARDNDKAPPKFNADPGNRIGANIDPSGGASDLVAATGNFETVDNPTWRGFNATYRGMLADKKSPAEIMEWAVSAGIQDPATLQSIQAQATFRQNNPKIPLSDYRTSNIGRLQRPLSFIEQKVNDASRSGPGTAALNYGNTAMLGIPQMIGGERAALGLNQINEESPWWALGGQVGGMVTGAGAVGATGGAAARRFAPSLLGGGKRAALGRGVATDATYGGTFGATTEGDPVTGALAMGGGRLGGELLTRGAGAAVRGVSGAGLERLNAAGVPLSIAQMMPEKGLAQRFFNKIESAPLYGDMVATRGAQANQRVYQGALDDAVSPVGGVVNPGDDALAQAQGIKSQGYTDAFSGINAPADFQYARDIVGPINAGKAIPGQTGEDFAYALENNLRPPFGNNRTLDGNGAQEFFQRIKDNAASFKTSGNFGNQASQAFNQIGDATEDLIARTNPGAVERITAANAVNARLTPLENATITANGGVPTPLQLRRAVTGNTKKFGGRATAARGDNVPQIVEDAASILPSRVPNSGTTDRMLAQMVLPAALGGSAVGADQFTDSPGLVASLVALAALSTKTGAKATQKALIGGKKRKAIGGFIQDQSRIGGLIGGPSTLLALPER